MRIQTKTSIFSPVLPLFHVSLNSAPSSPSSHPQIVILTSSNLEIPPLSFAPSSSGHPLPASLSVPITSSRVWIWNRPHELSASKKKLFFISRVTSTAEIYTLHFFKSANFLLKLLVHLYFIMCLSVLTFKITYDCADKDSTLNQYH